MVEFEVTTKGNKIYVDFPYNYQAVQRLKQIKGYRRDVVKNQYYVPNRPDVIDDLIDVKNTLKQYEEKDEGDYADLGDLSQYLDFPCNDDSGLEPPQAELLHKLNYIGKQLIADPVGYGKTIEAISFIREDITKRTPFLLVVPANLKTQWLRELTKWLDYSDIEILNGQTPRMLDKNKSYIINYEILQYWQIYLMKLPYKTLIVDECVAICNATTKRTHVVQKLSKRATYKFFLSATPWRKKPSQLWVVMNLLAPELFPNEAEFINMYCTRKKKIIKTRKRTIVTWEETGCKNAKNLTRLMQPYVTRREKTTREPRRIPLYFSVDTTYDREMQNQIKRLTRGDEFDKLYSSQQENSFFAKADQIIEWTNTIIDSGEKIILFAWHKSVIHHLQEQFGKRAVTISGDVPMHKRDGIIDKFRNEADILIGNWEATGVGVDGLHKIARICAFVQLPKTEYYVNQAIGRLDRRDKIGNVLAYFPMGYDTFDVPAYNSLVKTGNIQNSILGDTEERDFIQVFKDYVNERN
jgi:SWI/SNF-related matrix-associated actin-dependent regulator of chromatin subfamily A-like protein 1